MILGIHQCACYIHHMSIKTQYHTIIWDIQDTLVYPNHQASSLPAKKFGFDMVLLDWIISHQHINHLVITNYLQDYAKDLFDKAHIAKYFNCISGVNQGKEPKPSLSQYQQLPSQYTQIPLANQLMIGDQLSDMDFACRIGIDGLLIHSPIEPSPKNQYTIIRHSQDVVRWLDGDSNA